MISIIDCKCFLLFERKIACMTYTKRRTIMLLCVCRSIHIYRGIEVSHKCLDAKKVSGNIWLMMPFSFL